MNIIELHNEWYDQTLEDAFAYRSKKLLEKAKQTDKILTLDLLHISEEDLMWIHELKNKAAAMTGRLQLKHMKAAL